MCTTPKETCLRSFFLKVFFLPFFSGAAAPAAAAGFAMKSVLGRWLLVVGKISHPTIMHPNNSSKVTCLTVTSIVAPGFGQQPKTKTNDGSYVFAVAFFFCATVPLRGPLRVRALVCVRCPRTGKLRRCRKPR